MDRVPGGGGVWSHTSTYVGDVSCIYLWKKIDLSIRKATNRTPFFAKTAILEIQIRLYKSFYGVPLNYKLNSRCRHDRMLLAFLSGADFKYADFQEKILPRYIKNDPNIEVHMWLHQARVFLFSWSGLWQFMIFIRSGSEVLYWNPKAFIKKERL